MSCHSLHQRYDKTYSSKHPELHIYIRTTLTCGIPQSASEHWESPSWDGENPFQGCTLNSTCQWVSDLACALDEFYLPIYWWSLIMCKVLNWSVELFWMCGRDVKTRQCSLTPFSWVGTQENNLIPITFIRNKTSLPGRKFTAHFQI